MFLSNYKNIFLKPLTDDLFNHLFYSFSVCFSSFLFIDSFILYDHISFP